MKYLKKGCNKDYCTIQRCTSPQISKLYGNLYTYGGDPGPDGIMGNSDDLVYETVLSDLASNGIHVVTVDCQTGFGPGVYADAHTNLQNIATTSGTYYLYTSDQVDEGVIALIP